MRTEQSKSAVHHNFRRIILDVSSLHQIVAFLLEYTNVQPGQMMSSTVYHSGTCRPVFNKYAPYSPPRSRLLVSYSPSLRISSNTSSD
jgi:hypothetical protein